MPPQTETNPTEMRTKQGFAVLLLELADLYDKTGSSLELTMKLQAKAWRVASQKIATHDAPEELTEDSPRSYERVRGVGEGAIMLLKQYIRTGTVNELENLKADPYCNCFKEHVLNWFKRYKVRDAVGKFSNEHGYSPWSEFWFPLNQSDIDAIKSQDANEERERIRILQLIKKGKVMPFRAEVQHGGRLKLGDVEVFLTDLTGGRWNGFDAYKYKQVEFLLMLQKHKPAIDEYYDTILLNGGVGKDGFCDFHWKCSFFLRDYGATNAIEINTPDGAISQSTREKEKMHDEIRSDYINPILHKMKLKAFEDDDFFIKEAKEEEEAKAAKMREKEALAKLVAEREAEREAEQAEQAKRKIEAKKKKAEAEAKQVEATRRLAEIEAKIEAERRRKHEEAADAAMAQKEIEDELNAAATVAKAEVDAAVKAANEAEREATHVLRGPLSRDYM